jgi:hypothetical protein
MLQAGQYIGVFFPDVRGSNLGECGAAPAVLLGDFRQVFSRVLGAPHLITVVLLRSLMTAPSHLTHYNLHS